MSKTLTGIVCALIVGAAAVAGAATTDIKRGERKFLQNVAQHNMAEMQSGMLAAARAANPEVKNFGKQMVEDHGKNYNDVVQLAKAKGIALPGEPGRGHKKALEKLQKLSGAEFDKVYIDAMVSDHVKDVKEFEKMSRGANDPDVKTFAAKTLPTLEGHLKMARDVHSAVAKAK